MDFWNCIIAVYEINLRIKEEMELPPYKGSTLDGALDRAFHAGVCLHRQKGCQECISLKVCPYIALFEPQYLFQNLKDDEKIPRRYEKTPRPYVIEPPLERKLHYPPSEHLTFKIVLFGRGIRYFPWLIVALQSLEQRGLGKKRSKVELLEVRSIHPLDGKSKIIYQSDSQTGLVPNETYFIYPEEIFEKAKGLKSKKIKIKFLTPARIKYQGKWVGSLTFPQLFLAIDRRARLLSLFHGDGGKIIESDGLLREAENINLNFSSFRWYDWKRYSCSQGEIMRLGGIVGSATYVGKNLSRFMPHIVLGELIHVGKTHFGMGKYVIQELE